MKKTILMFIIGGAITCDSCKKMLPPAPKDEELLAGTIPGLSNSQQKEHLAGDADFSRVFSPADGLGPIYVQTSCSGCHVENGKGHPSTTLTRYAKMNGSVADYLLSKGGPQLQNHSINNYPTEIIPSEANVSTKRLAPAVMGLGYIAALSDQAILANSDPNDADGNGVSGRPNYVNPTSFFVPQDIHSANNGKYIGRFGKKAEKITIMDQVVFALKQDIGITSNFDMQDPFNYQAGANSGDAVSDPEVSADFVDRLVFYLRTLKAPQRRNINDADVIEGEKLFGQIGCTDCHVQSFITPRSDISALSDQTFHPYSDFLLHDMGPALDDGYPEGSATGNEWRTPPLWGIGLAKNSQGGKMYLLHDGRATSFESAITFHSGEASSRRNAFIGLPEAEKQKIIKFLESL